MIGSSRDWQRTLQQHSTTWKVVYDRKAGIYRVPSEHYRPIGNRPIGYLPPAVRFVTRPSGVLPRTLTFVVVGDDFASFQVAAQGVALKTALNQEHTAIETASFHAKGSSNVKRWRTKPGTYFVVTTSREYREWKVKLTPAAMKLLRHPAEFSARMWFGAID